MDRPSFEKLVQNSLRRLPRRFKNKIRNISIEIADSPSRAMLKEMGIERGSTRAARPMRLNDEKDLRALSKLNYNRIT